MIKRPVIPSAPPVAVYVTVPLPVPLVFPVRVIQSTRLEADQLHPAGAVTFTEPLPPFAGRFALAGEIEREQKVAGMRATMTVESCE
jgi:hypothetical protein